MADQEFLASFGVGIDSPMLIFAYIELCRYGYGFIRHGSQTCVAKNRRLMYDNVNQKGAVQNETSQAIAA